MKFNKRKTLLRGSSKRQIIHHSFCVKNRRWGLQATARGCTFSTSFPFLYSSPSHFVARMHLRDENEFSQRRKVENNCQPGKKRKNGLRASRLGIVYFLVAMWPTFFSNILFASSGSMCAISRRSCKTFIHGSA